MVYGCILGAPFFVVHDLTSCSYDIDYSVVMWVASVYSFMPLPIRVYKNPLEPSLRKYKPLLIKWRGWGDCKDDVLDVPLFFCPSVWLLYWFRIFVQWWCYIQLTAGEVSQAYNKAPPFQTEGYGEDCITGKDGKDNIELNLPRIATQSILGLNRRRLGIVNELTLLSTCTIFLCYTEQLNSQTPTTP